MNYFVVRMDKNFFLSTHYLTPYGWSAHASKPSHYPITFQSVQEARQAAKALKPMPRIRIWANSKAKQTLFHPVKGKQAYKDS